MSKETIEVLVAIVKGVLREIPDKERAEIVSDYCPSCGERYDEQEEQCWCT